MLYNPKWAVSVETKPSIEGLIAWLETQNPTTKYDWPSPDGCLVCKYYDALGINDWSQRRVWYYETFGGACDKYLFVGGTKPWTFGAALERARSIVG